MGFGEGLFRIAGRLSPSCSGLKMFHYPICLEAFMCFLEALNGNMDSVFQEEGGPNRHRLRNGIAAIALLSITFTFHFL